MIEALMDDKITLAFDTKTLDYIAQVLAQRPYGEVAPVLADMQRQITAQQQRQLEPVTGPQEAPHAPQATIPPTGT